MQQSHEESEHLCFGGELRTPAAGGRLKALNILVRGLGKQSIQISSGCTGITQSRRKAAEGPATVLPQCRRFFRELLRGNFGLLTW